MKMAPLLRAFAAQPRLPRADEILATGAKRGRMPELWDGRTAERIASHLAGWLGVHRAAEPEQVPS
jgi:UDP-N-acetylglucosamine 2-epimerase (non-hydrolysing)